MNEWNEDTVDFFVLNALSQQALSCGVLDQHMQRLRNMVEWMAARGGKAIITSTDVALQRLQRAGWLEIDPEQSDLHSERIYRLTSAGREHLEVERTHRAAALASFVESDALDDSFRQFLTRNN